MSAKAQVLRDCSKADPGTLLAAAAEMRDRLRQRQADDSRDCRLSSDTIAEFRAAGFFKILQPSSFGGLELLPSTLFNLEIALAEVDMSAAWVVTNMGLAAFHAALFDPRVQQEIWGSDPDAVLAFANMPGGKLIDAGSETYELSGQWRFSSGVDHADWVLLGALVHGDGPPVAGACLLAREDIEIVPDWDVVGLRGTGSHGIRASAVRIPHDRFLPHADRFYRRGPGLRVNTGPLYRLPLPQLLFRSISSASIGGLAGMMAAFLDANRERTSMMAQKIAADPHVQAVCATIDADLQAFRQVMEQDLDAMYRRGCPGDADDLAGRRRSRLNATRIPDACFMHAANLYRAAGASPLYRENPILHFFNDLLAARQHAANQFEVHARNDGAMLFGEQREDMLL
ncbi:hypothetical protein [Chelatococcus asaccharovorans]|uniref:3-hydroxy-9,10-secoandrosta-1,3,5(10)-triene-9, 17-dione monooxygenase n=1 Tax=Chelatococcus asaccharovorans TaxID=28210 RepID=A0A2V3U908_9HYPH|nr:hypothetical protein [Chelatococcus asaccharovorans]MBS7705405.1 hypothetical protein [Chelatococcus asaccharovorans]PXW60191.1 3-hydroxy-9,10-secoandrosta-1,3,5(10)-triene-9,17-dione monooxygenase [Chelatococcus asaccharovorans]